MKVKAEWPKVLPCKIALVGEAPGAEEDMHGTPFVGASGRLLDQMLEQAGISRSECLVTNVFDTKPPRNQLKHFFVKKKEARDVPHTTSHGAFGTQGYPIAAAEDQFTRLAEELAEARPNITVALGACALWALTGRTAIGTYRGFVLPSRTGSKVIGTYHPANVLREWSHRPVCIADLIKAKKESEFRDIRYPKRHVWVCEKPSDLDLFVRTYIEKSKKFAHDVETDGGQITHISLAPSPTVCLVIPLWFGDKNYFSEADEILIMQKLLRLMARRDLQKIAQNSTYDLTYYLEYGIKSLGRNDDTMLLHHSKHPEMSKSLGFMGSLYTEERPWKTLRVKSQEGEKSDA